MGFIGIGIIIVIIIIVSAVAGTVASNNPTTGAGTSQQGCEQCHLDRAWYNSLRPLKKVAYSCWWAARQVVCAMNGC